MEKDFEHIINHYDKLYKAHGYSDKSIGWGKRRKKLRYHVLCSKFNLNDSTILDFGCGFGDLWDYINLSYTGFN